MPLNSISFNFICFDVFSVYLRHSPLPLGSSKISDALGKSPLGMPLGSSKNFVVLGKSPFASASWFVQDFWCARESPLASASCLVHELCCVRKSQFYCVKNSQFYCVKLYRSPFRAQASRAILKLWKSSVSAIFNYTPYVGGLGVSVFFGSFLLLSEEMNENNTKPIQE